MHTTAMANCAAFFDTYAGSFEPGTRPRIIEIGSQDVNGSLREVAPADFEYVGVDFVTGKGVDVVIDDPYSLPFATGSADMIVSSSCFEHSEMFWLLFLEIMRVLKPHGLLYLNVPANGPFHRYPVDCWRFYPDSGRALVTWAQRNGMKSVLLESYTSEQYVDEWNDFVAVFLRDEAHVAAYPERIIDRILGCTNVVRHGSEVIAHQTTYPEDQRKLQALGHGVGVGYAAENKV